MKINWKSVGAWALSALGIATGLVGVLPPKAAAIVTALGTVAQAWSHKVVAPSP